MIKRTCTTVFISLIIFIVSFSYSTVHAAQTDSNPDWDIHLENVQIVEGSVTAVTTPTIDESETRIEYEVNLDTPGQFYEFTVDVKNSSSIDAVLDEVLSTTLTAEQQRYLAYSVTYDNGTSLRKNDSLNAGETDRIKVRIEFKRDITADDLPSSDATLDLALSLNYVADEEPENPDKPDNPDEPEKPDQPDNPDEPSNPDEPTNPDDGKDNGDSTDKTDNKNKDKNAKPANAQTGDNILICFTLIALAIVVLIFARRKNDKEN